MGKKIRWGILGAAKIAIDKMIPGIGKSGNGQLVAIASRDIQKAKDVAARFAIPKAHGSYEALLADPDVDAIYNPLPNHLHVPLSIAAMVAGKHVLCEKPIACTADEAATLIAARERTGKLVQEAAMVRTHPRWLGAKAWIAEGAIGELRSVMGFFSYYNVAPDNVRNLPGMGGGGLLDVGFYPVTMSRFLFGCEPVRVIGALDRDPVFGTDRLASAILEFPKGHAIFTCATQLVAHQSLDILGIKGRIAVETPWSWPHDKESRLLLDDGKHQRNHQQQARKFHSVDQWGWHAELFAQAILDGKPAPVPIEDAVANMRVLDAIARSAESGHWETP